MKILIYGCVLVFWVRFGDVSTYIHHKIVQIESCPDLGFYLANDTDLSFGHDVCNLCFCKENGTAVCWEREAYKCSSAYTLENGRIPRNRRSPFGWSELFGHDSSKPVFAKQNKQECQPYESSYSEGCPPDDWCIGCTVCDCSSEGRWDCHVLSFCGDKKKGDKEMLSKVPRNVRKNMKKKLTMKTVTTGRPKIVPKATQKKPTTTKPVINKQFEKKSFAKTNSNKQAIAAYNLKSASLKNGKKISRTNISQSNKMTIKPVFRKVIKRHELPTNLVTVKPPVSEMKTIRYIDKDDNSTVKLARMMIQKIFARIGKNFRRLYNNATNLPIAPCMHPKPDSVMTRIDNSMRPSKKEIYKNRKYRSKRSNDLGDITMESLSDITPLNVPLTNNNITDKVNITDDTTTRINNLTIYKNTIINLSSEADVVYDTITSTVSPNSLVIKNISDFKSVETNLHTIPLKEDEYPNTNITETDLPIIVENITSATPTMTTMKLKYKPLSQQPRMFKANLNLMPSYLRDLKLKMQILKMLYGVNELLPEHKNYGINDENTNFNIYDVTEKIDSEDTSETIKCSIIKKEKKNKNDLFCKMFGTCNLNDEKLLLLKSKLRSLKSDIFKIMYIVSSIKNMLKDIEYSTGYHKLNRRAFKGLSAEDDVAIKSFAPPRTHIEIINSMKKDIKYFLKRLDQFADQFEVVVKEVEKNSSLRTIAKNYKYTTDKSGKTKKVNRIYRKNFVKQLDRLLMKYNLPRNTFLTKIAQALYEHDTRTNSTRRYVNSRHPFSKSGKYITSREYAKKLLHNMRLLKIISEKLNSTKFREKRQIASEDNALNYLLTLLEIVVKQKFESKDGDGIDTLIDVIKSAPDIKLIRKNPIDFTTVVNRDYISSTAESMIFRANEDNHSTYHQSSEELLATMTHKPLEIPDDDESSFKDLTMPDTIVTVSSQADSTFPQDVFIQTTEASNVRNIEFYQPRLRLENFEDKEDEDRIPKKKITLELLINTTKRPSIAVVNDTNDKSNNAIDESSSNENSLISSRIGIPWAETTEELVSTTKKEKHQHTKLNTDNKKQEFKKVSAYQDVSNVSGGADDKVQTDEDSSKNDDDDNIMDKKHNELLTSLDYGGGDKVDDGNQEEKNANDIFD